MKVAVSVTKIIEVPDGTLPEVERKFETGEVDWYDVEAIAEVWSYGLVDYEHLPES